MRRLHLMLFTLLTGCASHPYLGLPLVMEDANTIKSVEVVVMTQQEPLQISRTRYDSSQTIALQTVGGAYGAIAANALQISANNQYARAEYDAVQITKPLQAQVEDMDYRETLRTLSESALKKDGRFMITSIVTADQKGNVFGSKKYAKNSDADAVLFIIAYLEMSPGLILSNTVHYQLVAKTGEIMLNNQMTFTLLPPGQNMREKMVWWNTDNRYRNAVKHSAYAIAALMNNQIFDKNDFITRAALLQKNNDLRNSSKQNNVAETDREKPTPCNNMPSSDRYVAENYAIQKARAGEWFIESLKCSSGDSR
jgi:hypothetical protein